METQSALGSALQAAFKLLSPTGGRMSVFQTQLPNLGVGALQSREDPNQRASAKVGAVMVRFVQNINEKCVGHCTDYGLNSSIPHSSIIFLENTRCCIIVPTNIENAHYSRIIPVLLI